MKLMTNDQGQINDKGPRTNDQRMTKREISKSCPGFEALDLGILWSLGSCHWSFSHELLHRRATGIHQILRPAAQVGDRDFAHVDAEVVIERGEDVAELDRPIGGLAAQAIGRADD